MNKATRRLGFEFFSIVMAVVLAMALTEWRQTKLNYRQAEASFKNIIEEIEDNYEELLEDSTTLSQNLKDIGTWLAVDTDKRDTLDLSINFSLSFLSSSAWEVAKLNQSLTFLKNEKVLALSAVYESQEFYEKTGSEVFDAMINLIKLDDKNSIEYKQELVAFRFKMRLAYGSVVTYTAVARNFLAEYATPSDSIGQ